MAERRPIIELETSEGPRQIFSIDEARAFLSAEEKYWSLLHHGKTADSPFNVVESRLQTARAPLQRSEFSDAAIAEVRAAFQNVFSGPNAAPLSFSQSAKVLQDVEAEYGYDGVRSALSLALPTGLGVGPTFGQTGPNFMASVKYLIGMSGVSISSATAAQQAFHDAAVAAAARAEEDRKEVTHLLNEQKAILDDLRVQAANENGLRQSAANKQQDEIANKSTAAIEAIDATRKAYDEFMHLKAPVAYWQQKAKDHWLGSLLWGALSWLYLGALGGGGGWALWTYREAIGQFVLEFKDSPGSLLILSAALALLASIPLWGARILVRFYLSEVHLAADARERVTMTETYLALTKDSVADKKDRAIILSAIFRNAQDGVVKETVAPDMTLGGILARILDAK